MNSKAYKYLNLVHIKSINTVIETLSLKSRGYKFELWIGQLQESDLNRHAF